MDACFFVCFRALACALAIVSGCIAAAATGDWRRDTWRGESAWVSESSGWRAVVSEARGRLIEFAEAEAGAPNLLQAPEDRDAALAYGGHRAWLGPQRDWKVSWPAPRDWEWSASASVAARGAVLELRMPRTDADYPELVRTYAWSGHQLLMGLSWRAEGTRHFQAIHILQMSGCTVARLPVQDTAWLPFGYGVIDPDQSRLVIPQDGDHPSVARTGGQLLVQRSTRMVKLGFTPQSLEAYSRGYRVRLHPHSHRGELLDAPDAGLVTQVFLGDLGFELVEIEQLSPRLGPDEEGWAEFVVRLEAQRAGPEP